MAICQDFWENPQRKGPLDTDQLTNERRGQYLVSDDGEVHIASTAYFGEESPGGSVDVEMLAYCLTEISNGTHVLAREVPAGRLVCRECRRMHGYFLVDQANP